MEREVGCDPSGYWAFWNLLCGMRCACGSSWCARIWPLLLSVTSLSHVCSHGNSQSHSPLPSSSASSFPCSAVGACQVQPHPRFSGVLGLSHSARFRGSHYKHCSLSSESCTTTLLFRFTTPLLSPQAPLLSLQPHCSLSALSPQSLPRAPDTVANPHLLLLRHHPLRAEVKPRLLELVEVHAVVAILVVLSSSRILLAPSQRHTPKPQHRSAPLRLTRQTQEVENKIRHTPAFQATVPARM